MNKVYTDSRYRTLTPSQILSWVEDGAQVYWLNLHAFTGSQKFLEDALERHDSLRHCVFCLNVI